MFRLEAEERLLTYRDLVEHLGVRGVQVREGGKSRQLIKDRGGTEGGREDLTPSTCT